MENHLNEDLVDVAEADENTTLAVDTSETEPETGEGEEENISEETETETEPEGSEQEKEPEKPKRRISGFEKRLNRERRKTQEANERATRLQEQIDASAVEPEIDEGEVDYTDPESIKALAKVSIVALAKAEGIKAYREESERVDRENMQRKNQSIAEEANDNYTSLVEAELDAEDFSDRLDTTPINPSPDVQHSIKSSRNAGKIAKYLAFNPETAQEIATMTPIEAIMAIGRIDGGFAKKTVKRKVNSGMTEPIETVGNQSGKKNREYADDMSDSDFSKAFPNLPN